ncbi:MAG: tagatose 1,6-diphosphate aldolase, partial [Pirellulales bacterium]
LCELINADDPASVTPAELTEFKLQLLQHAAADASAVILDPVYSASQAITTGSLRGQVGFLVKAEQEAYVGQPYARRTRLIEGWSAAKAKRMGACGVKLFLHYHPLAGRLAEQQEEVAAQVARECVAAEIPFFLEPVVYSIDPALKTESEEFATQRPSLVLESARRMAQLNPTVLKLQFPIDGNHETKESVGRQACEELNDAISVPWAILSGGDSFELFKTQLQIACEAGCSGFLAGRALWSEAAQLRGPERLTAIREIVLPRLRALGEVADRCGTSWMAKHAMPTVHEGML